MKSRVSVSQSESLLLSNRVVNTGGRGTSPWSIADQYPVSRLNYIPSMKIYSPLTVAVYS